MDKRPAALVAPFQCDRVPLPITKVIKVRKELPRCFEERAKPVTPLVLVSPGQIGAQHRIPLAARLEAV